MIKPAPAPLAKSDFRKSSFSTDGSGDQCVYVAHLGGVPTVEVRDSKRGLDTPGLRVDTGAFRAFIAGTSVNSPTAH